MYRLAELREDSDYIPFAKFEGKATYVDIRSVGPISVPRGRKGLDRS